MKLFWSPWAPVLRANIKLVRSHQVMLFGKMGKSELNLSTCYKQALPSVLQLTIRTTPSLTLSTLRKQLPFAACGKG